MSPIKNAQNKKKSDEVAHIVFVWFFSFALIFVGVPEPHFVVETLGYIDKRFLERAANQ